MAMGYFCAYYSYLESIELLTDAERGRLFTALLEYSSTGVTPEFKGNERFVFSGMKAQIDRDKKNYEDKCRKQSENARKRWQSQESVETEKKSAEPVRPAYVPQNTWTHPGCMSEEEAYQELLRRVRR